MDELKPNNKSLVLKLGGQCNLNCKHCHCKKLDFEFNPDIINYIQRESFGRITFSGGEPLLYFDVIKNVIQSLGQKSYKIVSNGNLLTDDIVEFLNHYNVRYFVSYDGENASRDKFSDIKFHCFKHLDHKGFAVLYSNETGDIRKLIADTDAVISKYDLRINTGLRMLNFPHQTTINPNTDITRETAQNYCLIIANFLETEFLLLKTSKGNTFNSFSKIPIISTIFNRLIRKHSFRGVKCFNENKVSLAINGDFLLCPYDDIVVGNIYDGIDWDKVESYIPERCKDCPLWESCMNTCIANITENECYISKVLHKHFYKLMDKYGYTYEQLEELIKE